MSGSSPWGALPWGALDDSTVVATAGGSAAERIAEARGALFLAVEVEFYTPGLAEPQALPWGAAPWGAVGPDAAPLESPITLRASDRGYVTLPADPPGLVVYPPILAEAVEIDRALALAPDGAGAGAAWGAVRLVNDDGALDALFTAANVDGRAVRVRAGRKIPQPHGYESDPSYSDTTEVFAGIGAGLALEDRGLRVELRDAGYWLERLVDGDAYAGTGGLEGNETLAGKRKPRVRGGTLAAPVRNVRPVLVDPAALIYQWTDAGGDLVTLYERGLDGGITDAGDVADLYSGSTPAGQYRTDAPRGLFQLGSTPAGEITVDCTGDFPSGEVATDAAAIALRVLLEDASVPAQWIDDGAFIGLSAARPWAAGFALDLDEPLDSVQVVGRLLGSIGARLVPRRTGRLSCVVLDVPAPGARPAYAYTAANVVACAHRRLPQPLDPPPARLRVGYARNHTVQTSDIAPTVTAARRQVLAEPVQVVSAAAAAVLNAWRRPSDPAVVETDLLDEADAQTLVDALADLWCTASGRRLWEVTVPIAFALRHEIGAAVSLTYPLAGLSAGALGRVVGERLRWAEGLATLQVLT